MSRTIQTTPAMVGCTHVDQRAFRVVSGREAQLIDLIAAARPHERAGSPEGHFARLMLPRWRLELAAIRGAKP